MPFKCHCKILLQSAWQNKKSYSIIYTPLCGNTDIWWILDHLNWTLNQTEKRGLAERPQKHKCLLLRSSRWFVILWFCIDVCVAVLQKERWSFEAGRGHQGSHQGRGHVCVCTCANSEREWKWPFEETVWLVCCLQDLKWDGTIWRNLQFISK